MDHARPIPEKLTHLNILLSVRRGGYLFCFREVVDVAKHLTDRQKKKIIADYATLGSYRAVARKNGVSADTVKRIVLQDPEIAQKTTQKKDENTADILQFMEDQKGDVCDIISLYLKALQDPERLRRASVQSIATSLGIIIDKFVGASSDAEEQRLRIAALKEKTGEGERNLEQFERIVSAAGGRFETKD